MKKLIVIAGPTAVGKTDFAINLAQKLETEIISCDSRQIFKEIKIGTARPSDEELKKVKHHFIASHSIFDYYNASMYEVEALKLTEKLFSKYDNLILAGGSGLYINALLFGIDDLPTIDPNLRHELQIKFETEGIESIRLMLKSLDPAYYKKVDLKNHKRILKALEVSIQTGKPYSSFLTGQKKKRNFEYQIIVLNRDRQILHQRINQRVDIMIDNGLLEEAKSLFQYRYLSPLKTVGYRELFDYFDGKTDLKTAIDLIKRNTRRYARKQITWFKKYQNAFFLNLDGDISIDDDLMEKLNL
jgi:tRNA dimethylallyltransferase